jgi:hypothetical protein
MNNVTNPDEENWMLRWIYTNDEWRHFEKWNAKNKGIFNYLWHLLFYRNRQVQSVELTEQWLKIGNKREYFNGPVTEFRRIHICEKGEINVICLTYENISKKQLKEVSIPIPKGKLIEAIEAQGRLTNRN